MNKSTTIVLSVIGGLILFLGVGFVAYFLFGKSVTNKIIVKEEAVTSQWANVETVYQRRMDLIPNLVATVKG